MHSAMVMGACRDAPVRCILGREGSAIGYRGGLCGFKKYARTTKSSTTKYGESFNIAFLH